MARYTGKERTSTSTRPTINRAVSNPLFSSLFMCISFQQDQLVNAYTYYHLIFSHLFTLHHFRTLSFSLSIIMCCFPAHIGDSNGWHRWAADRLIGSQLVLSFAALIAAAFICYQPDFDFEDSDFKLDTLPGNNIAKSHPAP